MRRRYKPTTQLHTMLLKWQAQTSRKSRQQILFNWTNHTPCFQSWSPMTNDKPRPPKWRSEKYNNLSLLCENLRLSFFKSHFKGDPLFFSAMEPDEEPHWQQLTYNFSPEGGHTHKEINLGEPNLTSSVDRFGCLWAEPCETCPTSMKLLEISWSQFHSTQASPHN